MAGKSPDRERKSMCRKMRRQTLSAPILVKMNPLFLDLAAGRTESAAAALGRRERGGGNQFRSRHRGDHHLSDALAAPDRKRRLAVVDQEHADLAAVIRIDRARCI